MNGWTRYLVAVLAGVAGAGLTAVLQPVIAGRAPFVLFFPIIAVAAVILGTGPALLATLLTVVVVDYFWMPPTQSIGIGTTSDQVLLLVSAASASLIAVVGGALRRSRVSQRESDALLRALVDSVPAAVYVKDATGELRLANERFRTITQRPECAGLLSRDDLDLLQVSSEETSERIVQCCERAFLSIKAPIMHAGQRMLCAVLTDITRQQSESASLVLSEERLRVALEAGRMGTWEWSIPTGVVKWSNGLEAIHGRPAGSFGGTFEDVLSDVHPEDRDLLAGSVQRSLREHVDHQVEYRILVGDEVRWLEARGRLMLDDAGEPARMVGVCMDITERKLAEAALQESEARFRRTADHSPVLIWVADTQNLGTWYNRPWLEFTGRTMEEELGNGWLEGVHPADRERCARECGQAFAKREPFTMEFRLRRHDGEYRWVVDQGTPMLDERGNFSGYTGSCVDITDRRNAEQRLGALADVGAAMAGSLDYEVALQRLANSAVPRLADWCAIDMLQPDGELRRVAVAHPDPRMVEKAHEFHRRYPPDRSVPGGIWDVIRTGRTEFVPTITEEMLDAAIRDPEKRAMLRELQLRSYIGLPLMSRGGVLGVLTLIYADSGRIYTEQDVAVAEEVARRASVAIENALLYAAEHAARADAERANQSKDRFLAVLSHELRTPLTPVLAGAQMLEADPSLVPDLHDIARLIRRNVELEARLIDDLLDLTRITQNKLELHPIVLDLHEKIRHVVQNCQGEIDHKQLTVHTSLDATARFIHGDKARVQQVLWNLLRNAIKFSQPGGRIEIATRDLERGRVRVDVRDNGIGIAPDVLPRIFNAFEQGGRDITRQFGGLGLGLAITKALVELHGGTITASSAGSGQGATFCIEFAGAVTTRPLRANLSPTIEAALTCEVLLVEDHEDTRAMMTRLLQHMGCTVHAAGSVQEALQLAGKVRADLVISDIGLPDGTGVELMRELRARHQLRGIALTGYGMEQDVAAAKDAGFDVHLTKPVEASVLRDQVRRLLASEPRSAGGNGVADGA